jgi:zinc protease
LTTEFPITPETITRVVLDNGIVVLVQENHTTPAITMRGRLRAGAMFDTDKTSGLAHFTTAALQRGTRKLTFQKLNAELDRRGMSFGVSAGMETSGFYGKALVEDFERLLEIAADVLRHPIFPAAEVGKLRGQILTGLREEKHDTRAVAYREFRARCFPKTHPFHRVAEGIEASVKKLVRADLEKFHARYFRPDGMQVVLVGDITPARAIELVQNTFGAWKTRGEKIAPEIPSASARGEPLRRNVPVPGKMQADVVFGYPGLARKNPDFYALYVGDLILGRLGLMGRLGDNIRDKQGLAYYVYSALEATLGAGPWAIFAGVNPRGVERAIESMIAEVKRMCETEVTQEELSEAQDYLTGSLALRLETNEGVASALADIEMYDLGLDHLQRFPQIIRSVTAEQIRAMFVKYARLESYTLVVAGPVEE